MCIRDRRGGAILTPNELVLSFGFFLRLCQFWWKSIKKCDRESARRGTDTQTDRRKPIFTALHGMQTRSYDEISVRLSVRLSVCLNMNLSSCSLKILKHMKTERNRWEVSSFPPKNSEVLQSGELKYCSNVLSRRFMLIIDRSFNKLTPVMGPFQHPVWALPTTPGVVYTCTHRAEKKHFWGA